MKLFLRADNLRHQYNIYDIYEFGTPLDEIIDEDSEEKYTFKGNIYLDDENNNRIATLECLFIDEGRIEYDDTEESISEIADINEDVTKNNPTMATKFSELNVGSNNTQ